MSSGTVSSSRSQARATAVGLATATPGSSVGDPVRGRRRTRRRRRRRVAGVAQGGGEDGADAAGADDADPQGARVELVISNLSFQSLRPPCDVAGPVWVPDGLLVQCCESTRAPGRWEGPPPFRTSHRRPDGRAAEAGERGGRDYARPLRCPALVEETPLRVTVRPARPGSPGRRIADVLRRAAPVLVSLVAALLAYLILGLVDHDGDVGALVEQEVVLVPWLTVLGTSLVWAVLVAVWAVVGRLPVALGLLAAGTGVLAFANHMKLDLRLEPVLPSDLVYVRDLRFLVEMVGVARVVLLVVVLAVLVLAGAAWWWLRRRAQPTTTRPRRPGGATSPSGGWSWPCRSPSSATPAVQQARQRAAPGVRGRRGQLGGLGPGAQLPAQRVRRRAAVQPRRRRDGAAAGLLGGRDGRDRRGATPPPRRRSTGTGPGRSTTRTSCWR